MSARLSTSPVRPDPLDDPSVHTGRLTPDLRRRGQSSFAENDDTTSPTSATISESGGSFYRMNEPPRPTLHHYPVTLNTSRKVTIRSDPALVTCFDPADKELHELWAPKQ
ncbi:hypothetical protein BV22DRAFT_820562 [Leucogyrophana mollusca]|uniref:Uncharacterized protein n=1 Tax=Leucogyrophana mollusca TaxID=85980 RepID=A0ACB8B446_9AGAM|nr:hypothetical protein BV22DRAFT_820562 [Leucogyrophana mollusca]